MFKSKTKQRRGVMDRQQDKLTKIQINWIDLPTINSKIKNYKRKWSRSMSLATIRATPIGKNMPWFLRWAMIRRAIICQTTGHQSLKLLRALWTLRTSRRPSRVSMNWCRARTWPGVCRSWTRAMARIRTWSTRSRHWISILYSIQSTSSAKVSGRPTALPLSTFRCLTSQRSDWIRAERAAIKKLACKMFWKCPPKSMWCSKTVRFSRWSIASISAMDSQVAEVF